MSCSNVIHAYTNAKYLYRGVSRWRQSFTCGRCEACISKSRTDWRVRSYYESLDCLTKSRDSFVLFDTLTYTDSYLRRYTDIYPDMQIPTLLNGFAFSRPDVQKFFKRLRINLRRDGYKFESSQLRYILTSEFGTDASGTHRPHYHLLFFVTFPINPIVFSRHVSRAWPFGKTDGVKPYDDCSECPVQSYCKGRCIYQSEQYVINERLVTNSSKKNVLKCVNYVTKYVSKDICKSGKLQSDVDMLWNYIAPEYKTDYLLYRKYRKFCSQVLPFHLQSQGFGKALIGDLGRRLGEFDFVEKTNKVHLPTGQKDVVRLVALPRYYQRKLYYDYVKEDGRVRWYLTDKGLNVKVARLDHEIDAFCREYSYYDPHLSFLRLRDLAIYKLVYQGTLSDYQSLMLPYKKYYTKMLRFHGKNEKILYENHNTKRDAMTIGKFLSTSYSVNPDGEIVYRGRQWHEHFIPFDGYVVVNDRLCPFWNGFDRKLVAFDRWKKGVALSRDAIAVRKVIDEDYYKSLGLLSFP